jgi:hypothetical protein
MDRSSHVCALMRGSSTSSTEEPEYGADIIIVLDIDTSKIVGRRFDSSPRAARLTNNSIVVDVTPSQRSLRDSLPSATGLKGRITIYCECSISAIFAISVAL